jgi:hypothetical protein
MADGFKYPTKRVRYDTLGAALKESQKTPHIGVTQGGSSRKNSGAKVAATTALKKEGQDYGKK